MIPDIVAVIGKYLEQNGFKHIVCYDLGWRIDVNLNTSIIFRDTLCIIYKYDKNDGMGLHPICLSYSDPQFLDKLILTI